MTHISGMKIRQRANGTYEVRAMSKDGTYKSLYAKTKNELYDKYKKFKSNNKKVVKKQKELLLKDWVKIWLDTYKKNNVAESTFKSITSICNRNIVKKLGDLPLTKITNLHCQEFVNSLNHLGNSKNKTFFYLKDILNKAVINKLIKSNPADNITITKKKMEEGQALSLENQMKLLNYNFNNEKLRLYYAFVLFTGCRKAEGLAFNHKTDVQNGYIHIKGTKTKGSDRYIPYFENIKELFKDNQDINFNDLKSDDVTRKIHLALPNNSIKDLRTTFATNCHECGIAPKIVQKWLGHTTIAMTMNIYTKVNDKFELEEATKISPRFTPKLTPKLTPENCD